MSGSSMDQATKSYWLEWKAKSKSSSLRKKAQVDVAIVGGGITGLSVALHLKQAGKTVAVIDERSICSGETANTTAHITEILDIRYHQIQSDFGKSEALEVAEACRTANNLISERVKELKIDCDFESVPGYLYTENRRQVRMLEKELSACIDVGISARWEDSVPVPFKTKGAFRVENQAQFYPRKYCMALAEQIQGDGSYIFENTLAYKMKDGEPCRVETTHGVVIAKDIVLATHYPSNNRFSMVAKIAAYRSYVIATYLNDFPAVKGLYWDTEDPYHYIRSFGDIWIIGGEDHKTGKSENTYENFNNLLKFTEAHFGIRAITNYWSGQIIESVDGLPYIGLNPGSKHTYIATGFRGNGMTFGSLSGILISDLILKQENRWAQLFSPSRFKLLASVYDMVYENVDYPLCMIQDHLLRRNTEKEDAISGLQSQEGCVVHRNGKEVAVYRDENSELHAVSAICPHMGCQVHWNRAEKSWDCPCHGSRFSAKGKLLHGPATSGLKPLPSMVESKKAPKKKAA